MTLKIKPSSFKPHLVKYTYSRGKFRDILIMNTNSRRHMHEMHESETEQRAWYSLCSRMSAQTVCPERASLMSIQN